MKSEEAEHNRQPLDNSTLPNDANGAFSCKEVPQNPKKKKGEVWELIWYILKVSIVLFLVYTFIVQAVLVSGNSMNNYFQNNDRLLIEKISVKMQKLSRFDVIVFQTDERNHNDYFIKRIIGLPGETVWIDNGNIYIDGILLHEDYGKEKMADAGIASEKIVLDEGEFFVLGDNRNNSKDSRSAEVGAIDEKMILGKVIVRFWPLQAFKIY